VARFGAVFFSLFLACGGSVPRGKPGHAPLVIAYRSIVQSLDPITENSLVSNSIYSNIYQTLVTRNAQVQIVPALAEYWVNEADDRIWTFRLRKNAQFQDGSPVLAEDVLFSLQRAKHDPLSAITSSVGMIERVEAPDNFTVQVITREPYPILLNKLADVWIVPKRAFSRGIKGEDIPPGSGPYRVVEWKAGSYMSLEAVKDYWGEPPAIELIRVEKVADPEARSEGFRKGEIGVLPHLEPAIAAKLMNRKETVIRNAPGLIVLYLGMDLSRKKSPYVDLPVNPFLDRRVRMAVAEAVDVNRLTDRILMGCATPATQLVAPFAFGYNDSISRPRYDPDAARKLLTEAGYGGGFSVRLDATNNRYMNDVQIAQAIASDLQKIGIQVRLNSVPMATLLELRKKKDTSFYMTGWGVPSGDSSGALDNLVHSEDTEGGYGSENTGGYSNLEVDRIIEESSQFMDPAGRRELLKGAMQVVIEDRAFIPLYIENNVTAFSDSLSYPEGSNLLLSFSNLRWMK
jgi:peptide/nickel transport system substrate-binding protein